MTNQLLTREYEVADLGGLEKLAKTLAIKLTGGVAIELQSDLGGGKTAFVRYLASALGSLDAVSSPSFTIENVYRCPSLVIHHFDFYRLDNPGICAYELSEALLDPGALVVVEWGQTVANLLPNDRLSIKISFDESIGFDARRFVFSVPKTLEHLLIELK